VEVQLPPARELEHLTSSELEDVLNPLFERGAVIATGLQGTSFSDWSDVMAAASAIVAELNPDQQVALLNGHARLGEDPRVLAQSSQISFEEQQAGLAEPCDEEGERVRQELLELGGQYQEKFGFPFVEFVAGRPLTAIVPVLRERMANSRDVELATGLAAIIDIAASRVAKATDHRKKDGI
jgi:2-oxo-4-hydroxy-4-carboxy-5-ureidoimidazoline decarboxylase